MDVIQLELRLIWKRPVEHAVERRLDGDGAFEWTPRVVCRCCGQEKATIHFTQDARNTGRLGCHSYCHDCRAQQQRRAYRSRRAAF